MNDNCQPKTPERTNWYVITGAPCSGKTSVLRGLEQRGFQVVDEVARAFIDSQLARGRTLAEIKADIGSFERRILFEKVRIEKNLSRNRTVFFDRAVPDSMAYFQVEGLEWKEPLDYSHKVRYKKIFLFDRLAFEKDAVRSENQITAARIESLLAACYQQLGYSLIRVPLMSIERRVDYILAHVADAG